MDKISLKSFPSKKQPNEWMLEHFKYNIEYENEENIEIDKRSISSKLPNCVFAVIYDKSVYLCGIKKYYCHINDDLNTEKSISYFADFQMFTPNIGFYIIKKLPIQNIRQLVHSGYRESLNIYYKCGNEEKRVYALNQIEIQAKGDFYIECFYNTGINEQSLVVYKNDQLFFEDNGIIKLDSCPWMCGKYIYSKVDDVDRFGKTYVAKHYYDYILEKELYLFTGKEPLIRRNLVESGMESWIRKIKVNPFLRTKRNNMLDLYKKCVQAYKKGARYDYSKIEELEYKTVIYSFVSKFSKHDNIAIALGIKYGIIKQVAYNEYIFEIPTNKPKAIDDIYSQLVEHDDVGESKLREYLNEVSLKQIIYNIGTAMWFINPEIEENEQYSFYRNEFLKVLKEEKVIVENEAFKYAAEQGIVMNKWRSEQILYALVLSFFNDAVYQYHADWLEQQSLDIYIPSYNIGIEYQGIQHYKAVEYFGGDQSYYKTVERDKKKKDLCSNNGITLIEWPYIMEISDKNLSSALKPYIGVLPEQKGTEGIFNLVSAKKKKKEKDKKKTIVAQYDLSGKLIATYGTMIEAGEKTGINKTLISFVVTGRHKTGGGYVWRKYDDITECLNAIPPVERIDNSKKVEQYDLDGNLLATFDSISMASNITDTNKNGIRKVAQGIWKSSGGFIWKFKEDESGI